MTSSAARAVGALLRRAKAAAVRSKRAKGGQRAVEGFDNVNRRLKFLCIVAARCSLFSSKELMFIRRVFLEAVVVVLSAYSMPSAGEIKVDYKRVLLAACFSVSR